MKRKRSIGPGAGDAVPQVTAAPANYRGRFLYLGALHEHWPEMLRSLTNECLPSMIAARTAAANQPRPNTATELQSSTAGDACYKQIGAWASSRGIRDGWLIDAAVQTLASLAGGLEPARWVYIPPELPIPMFEFKVNAVWIPQFPWNDFRKNVERQLDERLKEYRKAVAGIWGEDRRSHHSQALWTVWWQQGLSAAQIRIKSYSRDHIDVTAANIKMGVHGFTRSIGLTLRARKFPVRTSKVKTDPVF